MDTIAKIRKQSKEFSALYKNCFKQAFAKKGEKIPLKKRVLCFLLGIVGVLADMFLLSGRAMAVRPEEK